MKWLSSTFIGKAEVLVPSFYTRERIDQFAAELSALKV